MPIQALINKQLYINSKKKGNEILFNSNFTHNEKGWATESTLTVGFGFGIRKQTGLFVEG